MKNKYRVWWIPQVGNCKTFYIPVNSPEEGRKVMDVLAYYDMFQLQNRIKPDYCNMGGLEMYEDGEWVDWYMETDDDYFDDLDDYCESNCCTRKEELKQCKEYLFNQIDYKKVEKMQGM